MQSVRSVNLLVLIKKSLISEPKTTSIPHYDSRAKLTITSTYTIDYKYYL